jgi:hypothetical protein
MPEFSETIPVRQRISAADFVTAPVSLVPQTVSMAQARLALIGAGLFSAIDAGLKALPEPQRTTALTAWEYAPTVSRNGALVTTLAGQFGLTEAQLDALFTAAAAIEL